MSKVTRVLTAIDESDSQAAEELLPIVYQELRRLAAEKIAREAPGQTLQATALVHEAYLRLIGSDPPKHWNGPGHFYAAAAEAMRRILIDKARRKQSRKRAGNLRRVDLADIELAANGPSADVLALDEALEALAQQAPIKADLVKLRFFAGLTTEQAAKILGISVATAERYWVYARAWLYDMVFGDSEPPARM